MEAFRGMSALACQLARSLHRLGVHMRALGDSEIAVAAGE